MTVDGAPETEREAAAMALDAGGRPPIGDALDGRASVVEAADALGVPVNQVLRWAEDGTIPADRVSGRSSRAATLRIDGAWVIEMLGRRGEVGL